MKTLNRLLIHGLCGLAISVAATASFAKTPAPNTPSKERQPKLAKSAPGKKPLPASSTRTPSKMAKGLSAKPTSSSLRAGVPAKPSTAPAVVSAPATGNTQGSVRWLENARIWTRTIQAVDPSVGSIAIGQSLALAVDNHYLLLPLDFVSEANFSRDGVQFMVDDQPQQEAHVVDIDLAANLALLKVDQPLLPSFLRSQIRIAEPTRPEKYVEILARDWARPGVRFIGAKVDGRLTRYQMSLPPATNATVRFLFDITGQLVGMTSARSSQTKGSAEGLTTSAKSISELLRRQDSHKPASIGLEQRRQQLYMAQDQWTQSITPARKVLNLQSLDCRPNSPTISDRQIAAKISRIKSLHCQSSVSLLLSNDYSAGAEIQTGYIQVLNGAPDAKFSESQLAEALWSSTLADLEKATWSVNSMTTTECGENTVTNALGHRVYVRYCTAALKNEPGLNDTAVTITSLEPTGGARFAVGRLKGFGQVNAKKVMEALIENVRSLK